MAPRSSMPAHIHLSQRLGHRKTWLRSTSPMERLAESVISMGLDVDNLVLQIALFIGRAEPKLDYFRAPHSACCNASVLDRAFTLRTIRRLKSGRGPSSATCRDADCEWSESGETGFGNLRFL